MDGVLLICDFKSHNQLLLVLEANQHMITARFGSFFRISDESYSYLKNKSEKSKKKHMNHL